jgi:hypothetical protein
LQQAKQSKAKQQEEQQEENCELGLNHTHTHTHTHTHIKNTTPKCFCFCVWKKESKLEVGSSEQAFCIYWKTNPIPAAKIPTLSSSFFFLLGFLFWGTKNFHLEWQICRKTMN